MKHRAFLRLAKQLTTLETNEALYHLLKTNKHAFNLLAINPPYHVFQVPKRNGELRTIEDPSDELQKIQAQLKKYLQALYYCHRTNAAYGYISKADDEDEIRGIYGNALKHAANPYLLNIDLEDFFHFIHWQKIYSSLTSFPFQLNETIARDVCNICVLHGRLPMGAPTSPVLSNIAAYGFDIELTNYTRHNNIIFTRYVDDMSFSASTPITLEHFNSIEAIIKNHGYQLNEMKLKRFGPNEIKSVTGLEIVNGCVTVPQSFFSDVQNEIKNLGSWVLMQTRMHPEKSLDNHIAIPVQKIKGALAFIESVHTDKDERLTALYHQLDKSIQPPENYETINWLQIGYEVF